MKGGGQDKRGTGLWIGGGELESKAGAKNSAPAFG